jgi:hypothetical protein
MEINKLKDFVSDVLKKKEQIKNIAIDLKKSCSNLDLNKKLFFSVEQKPISLKVGAVDSGFLSYTYGGMDIVFYRAAGCVYHYFDSKMVSCSFFPSKSPKILVAYQQDLDDLDSSKFVSLTRLKEEINLAINLIKKYDLNLLFLDGSILPLAIDKPNEDSPIFNMYLDLIKSYKELFEISKNKKILLAAIAKESKSKAFLSFISKNNILSKPINGINDIVFLDFFLDEKERSAILSYAQSSSKNPILEDFKEFSNKIFLFYLKPSKNSYPFKIEFLENEDFNSLPSYLLSMCSISSKYSYPPVLIAADLCARIKEDSLTNILDYIEKNFSSRAYKTNFKPFK